MIHFNGKVWAILWNVWGTSLECLEHLNGMFGATSVGYLVHFIVIFGALKCNILGTSMEGFGHFNIIFGALQCNILGTSIECLERLNGIFGALR